MARVNPHLNGVLARTKAACDNTAVVNCRGETIVFVESTRPGYTRKDETGRRSKTSRAEMIHCPGVSPVVLPVRRVFEKSKKILAGGGGE